MRYLGYILTYSFIRLLALLPERVMYLFSDLLYLLAYYVAGYRKKVVYANLAGAFPDMAPRQLRSTARGFYRHLCDLIVESAASLFFSRTRAMKVMTYRNPELINGLYTTGRQVIAVTAHYGNWEYMTTLATHIEYPVIGIYKPLKNKYFDKLIRKSRTKYGSRVIPMEQVARTLMTHYRQQRPVLTMFLSDQRPIFQHIQYWTKFLGQDTPLYLGAEKLARKLDAAVVFLKVSKVGRGRYAMEAELICEDPSGMQPYGITEAHVGILEDMIRKAPEYWLWSHRRWKHSLERYLQEKKAPSHPTG